MRPLDTVHPMSAGLRAPALLLVLFSSAALAAPPKAALVFCAPGYPGTTEEAQPRMDEVAQALGELAGWPKERLSAVYFPQEKAGLARLAEADAALALVPLPLFLAREAELKLTARLAVVQKGFTATQSWTLVAKKGRLTAAKDLDGWTVFSTAGYAPDFVTRTALAGYGPLPATLKVTGGGQVLSALRKASTGENLAVLLDAEQAASVASLPFAAELETVHVGPKVPVAVVATVGDRLSASDWKALAAAFPKLASTPRGAAALEGVRLTGFAPLDEAALAAARKAWAGGAR